MQSCSEQLGAYVLWLNDRGLRFPVARPASLPDGGLSKPSAIQVAFVSDEALRPNERELLDKMIAAMQLDGEHVVLERADEIATLTARLVIPLGAVAAAQILECGYGGDALPTLHPRDLLLRPEEKRVAWNDLKRAMARLKE